MKKEPLLRLDLREILNMTDIYTIAILSIYAIFAIIFYYFIENASELILLNLLIIAAVLSIAIVATRMRAGRLFMLFRRLYIVPLILFIYSQVQYYIKVLNPHDYDYLLIQWDKAIFGLNPTQWLIHISFPALTEYLQVSYMLYFLMPLMLGIELHRMKRGNEFKIFSRLIVFSFYCSYLLYMALPAVGPRFMLHSFYSMNMDLPGLWITNILRDIVNTGESIPLGSLEAIRHVNRDCMPSGHTWITLVNMYLGFRFHSKFRWFFFVVGFSLIFATVYLRYHYVVDVIAGIIFAFLTILIEPKIRSYFRSLGFRKA